MGKSINSNVALSMEDEDIRAVRRLGITEPDGDEQYKNAFVFAVVRSPEENCLSYVVIARNEAKGQALIEHIESAEGRVTDPLRNVRRAYRTAAGGSALGEQGSSSAREAPSDVAVFSSCCNFSKNVTVLLAGRNGSGHPDTVTLLDRYVHASFRQEPKNEPLKWPITKLDIKTVEHEGADYCLCK